MIKRNVYATLIALLLTTCGMAQLMVIQRIPPPTQFNPTDAWKVDIINQGSSAVQVFLRAAIVQKPSVPIVSLTSAVITLQPGSQSLSPQMVQTQQEQYSNFPGIEQIRQFHELPFGEYEICVEVISAEDQSELAQSCIDHTFMPVTPPVLVLPPSCQDPGTRYPLMTWFAPSPLLKGFTILYDLKLTELQEGQSYEEAIQRNLAVLDVKGIRTTQLVYPSNALPLDTAKTYVWQVSARVPLINRDAGGTEYSNSIGMSEIWCIRFDKKKEEKDTALHSYAIPKPQSDGAYTEARNVLRFAYVERYVPHELDYVLTNEKGETIDIRQPLNVVPGDNRYDLDLKSTGMFRHNKSYILRITNGQGEKMYLRFKYIEE